MDLQTQIPLQPQKYDQIDYNSEVVLLGSCFSENIGAKFSYFKFRTRINPFGILFNPLAIERFITRAINSDYYSEDELLFNNEQWLCLDAHSKLNSSSKDGLLSKLNSNLDDSLQKLTNATHVIITLGTSWVYRHIETDRIVSNCHKIPQKHFLKELLSVDTISQSLDAIISLVRSVNPKVNVIFTVSPVRHLKDGFVENTQSKAHLISAVHNMIDHRLHQYYFPSYELMMDELRDYRFYKSDMIHPNGIAIDYIWNKFKMVWVAEGAHAMMDEVESIQKGLNHKPFNPNSEAHQQFLKSLETRINQLQGAFPFIKF
ncbi:GSCFA domain-containing protein [Winogradskyella tangerina]|uniref:GSCFA domain-containing protein n=1 Tax=Winogradskyella tangerina TaxID=2023240 RepID=UPI000DBE3C8A|nr:GSCFA domain-containing protein [Winogradskyella tangerina]